MQVDCRCCCTDHSSLILGHDKGMPISSEPALPEALASALSNPSQGSGAYSVAHGHDQQGQPKACKLQSRVSIRLQLTRS